MRAHQNLDDSLSQVYTTERYVHPIEHILYTKVSVRKCANARLKEGR